MLISSNPLPSSHWDGPLPPTPTPIYHQLSLYVIRIKKKTTNEGLYDANYHRKDKDEDSDEDENDHQDNTLIER